MKNTFLLILTVFNIIGCSSSRMIQQYKNPEIDVFQANKVLVIGLNSNAKLRTMFEKELVAVLESEDVSAVKSIDFFESSFTKEKKTIKELNTIENKLLEAGFDAILLTKIIGKEKRFYTTRLYYEYMKGNQTFEDYYYGNQYLYLKRKDKKEDYLVYITETSLYCICPEKERELLWRGEIEIHEAKKMKKNIDEYIYILTKGLKEDELLLYK